MLASSISLDRHHRDGLVRQIFGQIRQLIIGGRLAVGARLPTSRQLAGDLAVSRNTIVAAYDQLILEGYLETDGRRGTRVSEASAGFSVRSSKDVTGDVANAIAPRLSREARALMDVSRRERSISHYFQTGLPDIRSFPHDVWARMLRRAARQVALDERLGGYDHYCGLPELRAAILDHVRVSRGVVADVDQVIVLSSAQAALDLTSRMLLDIGEAALIEEPGYAGVLASLKAVGAKLSPICVDNPDCYQSMGDDVQPRLMYVTPSHQFPTGRLMSLEDRLALLDQAAEQQAFILEDDYDSEFRFKGAPISCLQGLDQRGLVVYMGTFSKSLMPGMRVAYLIVPKSLGRTAERMLRNVGSVPALIQQKALASFIAEGYFRAHIREMSRLYQQRQDCLIEAIGEKCADYLTISSGDGGMQLCAYLTDTCLSLGWTDTRLVDRLEERGIEAGALSVLYWSGQISPRQGLFLGFAASDISEILKGVDGIAAILEGDAP